MKKVRYSLMLSGEVIEHELSNQILNIASVPPLSKFGIEPLFEFINRNFDSGTNQPIYGYTATNTHCTIGEVRIDNIPANVKVISDIKVEIVEENYI